MDKSTRLFARSCDFFDLPDMDGYERREHTNELIRLLSERLRISPKRCDRRSFTSDFYPPPIHCFTISIEFLFDLHDGDQSIMINWIHCQQVWDCKLGGLPGSHSFYLVFRVDFWSSLFVLLIINAGPVSFFDSDLGRGLSCQDRISIQ